jgi:hypothetical protein
MNNIKFTKDNAPILLIGDVMDRLLYTKRLCFYSDAGFLLAEAISRIGV